MIVRGLILTAVLSLSGCAFLPEIAHQPTLHNPYPQLSKVAVAEFFNQSSEPTVNGHQFALAYYNELQSVPGFEVVPVDVVNRAIEDNHIELNGPEDARRLAQILGVDAVVIGTVTDFSPYYPPRCGLQVHWYAANPCFHPIPPGYGLPWGTPAEEQIPGSLVLEAEMALAREQLATQTPVPPVQPTEAPPAPPTPTPTPPPHPDGQAPGQSGQTNGQPGPSPNQSNNRSRGEGVEKAAYVADAAGPPQSAPQQPCIPPGWPDSRGFIPPAPQCRRPGCWPTNEPVMQHTRTYNGNDPQFTEALENYYFFRDDARFGGWQNYLERSDDFIRFCCHMHIWEMLSARGGAGETRVVWRWHEIR